MSRPRFQPPHIALSRWAGESVRAFAEAASGTKGKPVHAFTQWRASEWGIEPLDDLVKSRGVSIYREMEQRDDMVASCLRVRRLARLSTGIEVTPRDERNPKAMVAAELVKHNNDKMRGGSVHRFAEQTMDAYGMGHSCQAQDVGDLEEWILDGKSYQIRRITGHRALPQETLAYFTDAHGRLEWIGQSKAMQLSLPGYSPGQYDRIEPDQCVVWTPNRQGWDTPLGMSWLRPAHPYYESKINLRLWFFRFLEYYGLPVIEMGFEDDVSDSQMTSALAQLRNMMGNRVLVRKCAGEYNVHSVTGTGVAQYEQALAYCNRSIARALSIPSLLVEGGESVGSNALGQSHNEVFSWSIDADGEFLSDEVLEEQYADRLVSRNLGPEYPCPYVRFRDFRTKDLMVLSTVVKMLVDLGLEIPRAFAHKIFGFPAAKPDEDILENKVQPMLAGPSLDAIEEDEEQDEPRKKQSRALARDLAEAGDVDGLLAVASGNGKHSRAYARNGWAR